MSWLKLWDRILPKKDNIEQEQKKMSLQTGTRNLYIDQLVKQMIWSGNIKMDGDSRSFVKDGYGGNVDIYSIINYVITTAAKIKFKVQVLEGDEWIDDNSSPLLKLLNRPNPMVTRSLFIEESLGWKLIDGAMYIYAPRLENGVNKGQTLELWTMPSTDMMIVGGGVRKPIEGFRYNHWDEIIPVEKVLYLRYFNPVDAIERLPGSLVGMSPLRAAYLTAIRSNSAAQAGVSAYENNGAMGILSRSNNQFAEFGPEQAQNISEAFRRNNGGADKFNTVAVTPGQVEFQRMNMSPADLRLGESELQGKRQIAAMYKVPTQLLNDADGATFSNQKEAQKSVYTNTILPELEQLGEGVVNWLGDSYYPNDTIQIIPDTSGIEVLQQDKSEQVSWLVNAHWMTGNEKRAEMGLGVDSETDVMDDYLIPNNLTASKDLSVLGEINDFGDDSGEGEVEE